MHSDIFSANFRDFVFFEGLGLSHDAVRPLIEQAKSSFAPSIDLFTYQNEETVALSKLYCTRRILAGMYTPSTGRGSYAGTRVCPTYTWRSPRIKDEHSWISHLLRRYTDGCDSVDDLKRNRLSIISFNYDAIFEDAFKHLLTRNTRYSEATDEHCPNVYHVYGTFPIVDNHLSGRDILNASEQIRFMYEATNANSSKNTDKTLRRIKETINDASYIYIIGFHADERNTNLIELQKGHASIFAINHGADPGLQSRLVALGASKDTIISSTLTEGCSSGFFDLDRMHPAPDYSIRFI